ncbi:unnamed protein product, partial [Timema podura]|nr:unnamed protein product [Timema podura]
MLPEHFRRSFSYLYPHMSEHNVAGVEPLNSGDDVSDDDPTDLFDTDNVVVCQYDKVRVPNMEFL